MDVPLRLRELRLCVAPFKYREVRREGNVRKFENGTFAFTVTAKNENSEIPPGMIRTIRKKGAMSPTRGMVSDEVFYRPAKQKP